MNKTKRITTSTKKRRMRQTSRKQSGGYIYDKSIKSSVIRNTPKTLKTTTNTVKKSINTSTSKI